MIVASPPCQEFSVSSQPFKRSRAKFNKDNPPDRSLWDAAVTISKKLNVPLILENVRSAEKFMGKRTWNYGSYYFWGESPWKHMKNLTFAPQPFLKENGVMSNRKGFQRSDTSTFGAGRDDSIKEIAHKRSPKDGKTYLGNVKARNGLQRTKNIFVGECNRIDGLKGGLSRKKWAARVAMIPEELSTWIGECFKPKLEV